MAMWKHSVQSLVKPLGLLQLIVEREAPDVILVVVRNGFPGSASTFNLEQEVFFPFVLCYQVLALRFNKNPVLFHAGAVPIFGELGSKRSPLSNEYSISWRSLRTRYTDSYSRFKAST